jgi:PhnB protein
MNSGNKTIVTPFLVVNNGANAVSFYTAAFGGKELVRYTKHDGKLMSKIAIEGAEFWLGDEEQEFDNLSPDTIGGTAVRMILTIADPDSIFNNAKKAGATEICPVRTEEFWRIGKLKDPFGHIWEIGHPLDQKK